MKVRPVLRTCRRMVAVVAIAVIGSSSASCAPRSSQSGDPQPEKTTGVNVEYDDAAAHEQARAMGRALYYVYLLKKGPTWSPDSTAEIDALQEAHLANLNRLRQEGKLVLNGPLLDAFQLSGEIRGIGVLKATSMDEARSWIGTDPMVRVGRLVFELHAWMVPQGVLP